MRVADRVTVSPARRVAGALRVPGRQIHLASVCPARRHCRRPIHHRQLRAGRRLRVDACLHERPRRHRLTNASARRGRPAARHHRRPRPARPPRRVRAARLRQLRQHDADARRRHCRSSLFIDPDRRCFTVAPADAPNHRAAHRRWAPRSPPAPATARRWPSSGGNLAGIQFTPDTPSAQVKSAVLLAGLQAAGETVGPRACLYPRSYGTGPVGVRRTRCTIEGRRITAAGRPAADGPGFAGPGGHLVRRVHGGRRRGHARIRRHHHAASASTPAAPRCSMC